ncbi:MAG: lipoprotein insertase outer membrane protein LolB [Gammaproteobacteria bacterium]
MAGKIKLGLCFLLIALLAGCAVKPVGVVSKFNRNEREGLYRLTSWAFDGRVAVKSVDDSWTANISWKRRLEDENIRLSGPLGQGGVAIHIGDNFVSIDRGDGEVSYWEPSDAFISEQLGFYVPLKSLRYWVVGLIDPDTAFEDIENGFVQNGWTVLIRQMQRTGFGMMPRRIDVSNQDVKLKLIIDQWQEQN